MEFWNFLYKQNRVRALEISLKIAARETGHSSFIRWHLQRVINHEENSDLLIEFAQFSEDQAKVTCDILTSESSVFWQIAFEIIQQYPDSQAIKDTLSYLAINPSPLLSRLKYLENGLNSVEQALKERHPPFHARLWLDELQSYLHIEIEKEQGSQEIDLLSNSTSIQLSRSPDSERVWAIRELLNNGEAERIRQLLSHDEFLELVAMPDLSETERQQLRNLFELESTNLSVSNSTSANVNIPSIENLILMSNQPPIFNQQNATIGVSYAAEGSKQEFTQNVEVTEQAFEILLSDFEQFINELNQKHPNAMDETAIQKIIDIEAKEIQKNQPSRWQNFLSLKRLWNGGKKAAFKVGEHYAE